MADKVHIVTDPIDTLDQPRFDFSRVSYKREREASLLIAKMTHVGKKIDAAGADVDIAPFIEEFESLRDQQEKHLFEVVAYVPQAWLIKGAPPAESIDWQDHESLQWLRSDKFKELGKAKRVAEGDSPN